MTISVYENWVGKSIAKIKIMVDTRFKDVKIDSKIVSVSLKTR